MGMWIENLSARECSMTLEILAKVRSAMVFTDVTMARNFVFVIESGAVARDEIKSVGRNIL